MTKDLRSFLDFLRQEHPEEILEIKGQVDLEYDMTTYCHGAGKAGQIPAAFLPGCKRLSLSCSREHLCQPAQDRLWDRPGGKGFDLWLEGAFS